MMRNNSAGEILLFNAVEAADLTKLRSRRGVTALAGLVCVTALAISAAPAAATRVCPSGTTSLSQCTNLLPIAVTGQANAIGPTTATLNGVSGPGVRNGDVTQYQFEYGLTTAYGHQSPNPPGTVGACPAGASSPNYCQGTPAAQNVSAKAFNLTPCTTYHFRLDSWNPDSAGQPDGRVHGDDQTFLTAFLKPIASAGTRHKVKNGKPLKVHVRLITRALLTIQVVHNGRVVASQRLGVRVGNIQATFRAPHKRGKYGVRVIGQESCGKQTVTKKLRVF
jgi:hypothetical protein